MADPIRVGIIGANPERGWAVRAHIPALRALPDYRITAVGTSRTESARAAAELVGGAHAFTDPRQLAEHPDVDLVAITVKVPAHATLIRAALAAGKHVYCEWPLALTTDEAVELSGMAAAAGVRHAVGLQARYAPEIRRARDLIAEGYVGEVVSVTVYSPRGKGAGTTVPGWVAYTLDERNGAGVLEVAGGHTLDAVRYLVGDFAEVSAQLSIRHPHNTIAETGERIAVTSPDHVLLTGALDGGAVISAHIHDAKLTDDPTRVAISGTEGDLAIVSDARPLGGIQMSELRLFGSRGVHGTWRELGERTGLAAELGTEPRNVAGLYAALAEDIRTGTHTVPTFADGVRVHRLLDAIRRSAESGRRLSAR
ncbi:MULTISPECIES: Gfo/Idh/MocA family protein [unclassified Nocardia]|uniref:Gfo/Idh/MocA family protein n=1 Tax=unclassified Nocardia TaxID=2637762 RepID=UPI001CE44B5E|nr:MULTISPECIES: Gfo/Idh/MocA family oxidoreductase [unclassified Nocardia]